MSSDNDPARPDLGTLPEGTAAPGANLLALRGHNTALVLGLLRAAGEQGVSRLELAERTGLTPQAVSKITARLRADGLAAEAGRRASTGGKPRTVLRLVPGARHAVGVHLDRDELTCVLADLTGRPAAVRRAPLDFGAGAGTVLATTAREVAALRDAAGGAPGARPGVASPRPRGPATGGRRHCPRAPHWGRLPLRDALAEALGLPVVLDKDTNAAALGLSRAPKEPGGASFAYLHLGTGLGAGLVLGGALYRGPHTGAGEFGHQVVQLDGPRCDCGRRGCVEALCLAAVARDDLPAAARVLGVAAANLVELLDIDRVLLGGRTVLAHPERFRDGVARALADHAALRGRPGAAPGGGAAAAVPGVGAGGDGAGLALPVRLGEARQAALGRAQQGVDRAG
ncbi:ROK family protein, partial [Streptomyces sp. NPDC059101]|uniref:ROK family transcriptional regulator n=1 Tax=Streptomyces sp. NPDC059101 TaxID=3346728 RepID=UPI0036738A66